MRGTAGLPAPHPACRLPRTPPTPLHESLFSSLWPSHPSPRSGGRTQEPTSVPHLCCGLGHTPCPSLSLRGPAEAGQLPESLLTLTLPPGLSGQLLELCPPFSLRLDHLSFSLDPLRSPPHLSLWPPRDSLRPTSHISPSFSPLLPPPPHAMPILQLPLTLSSQQVGSQQLRALQRGPSR